MKRAGIAIISLLLLGSATACGSTERGGTKQTKGTATSSKANDSGPVWSPNGRRIAFDCGDHLCVIYADGTHRRRLTKTVIVDSPLGGKTSLWDLDFDWSPDGRKFAFVLSRATAASYLYVMDADGTHERLLRDGLDFGDFGATVAWSPDGRKLALVAGFLYLMNADGSGMRELFAPPSKCGDVPHWSPDGQRIVFSGGFGNVACVVNTDDSPALLLPPGRAHAWSPDGAEIAFDSGDGIRLINADGSKNRRLTHDSNDYLPKWSPNGGQIAFQHGKTLYLINADGSGKRRLTKGEDPDWSPDGTKIAFDRGKRIYVINADGSGERQLT